MLPLYALNLFDLADNDLYRQYSKRSVKAVQKHGGEVISLGKLSGSQLLGGSEVTKPRGVMILVKWPDRDAFDAFVDDPDHEDLHPLREDGTENYLWWLYDSLDDLRPLFERG